MAAIGVVFLSCIGSSDGNNKDPYINPYANVNGEVVSVQSQAVQGVIINGKELRYITAFSYDNGMLTYSVSDIDQNGKFYLPLKRNLVYNFVIFDSQLEPVVYVSMNGNNVIHIKDDSFIRILIQLSQNGAITVSDLELDENTELVYDNLFDDDNNNFLPDIVEEDNDNDGMPDYDEDGDGIFDGIEENDD